MPNLPQVFLCHSHADREFVAKLAIDLTLRHVPVWYDEWELKVGDSLRDRIQRGLTTSGYLAIILSPDSVGSKWVSVELNAALAREMEEDKVYVLPVLIGDCEIPPFLRDKLYADFRLDYDAGLQALMRRLQVLSSAVAGRTSCANWINDFSVDCGTVRHRRMLVISIVSYGPALDYSVMCTVTAIPNKTLDRRWARYEAAGFEWAPRMFALSLACELLRPEANARILLPDNREAVRELTFLDRKKDIHLRVKIAARRLGPDPGTDTLYEYASVLDYISEQDKRELDAVVTRDTWMRLAELMARLG